MFQKWRKQNIVKEADSDQEEALLNDKQLNEEMEPYLLKKSSTLLTVTPFILGNEFCERLAFYGLATNLQVYLTTVLGIEPAPAATQVGLFSGTCYITPILGAWLADSHWGRYKTILVFSMIYLMGLFWLVATTIIPGLVPPSQQVANSLQYGALLLALYTIAVGTGGIKANVSTFGADQFDDRNPQDVVEKASFFNWFYFAINVGSFIASTIVVYVQEAVSWTIGYLIPAIALSIAIASFVLGSGKYKHVPTGESPIARVFKVMGAQISGKSNGYNKRQLEEVYSVLRLFPIFITSVMYWAVYSTMGSMFVEQGTQMDTNVNLFGLNIQVPAATMSMVDTIAIIILVPIYDNLFLPLLKRYGIAFSQLQRIGWGYIVAVLAMLSAAMVEQCRKKAIDDGNYTINDSSRFSIHVSEMSLFYMGIPYFVIGTSEVLASIGQLEFFYDQAPYTMRSFCMAMQLVSTALGSYLYSFLVYGVNAITSTNWWINNVTGQWLPPDLYKGHLDYFYLLFAFLALLNFGAFVWVARSYKYSEANSPPTGEEDDEVVEILSQPHAQPVTIQQTNQPSVDDRFARSIAYHGETPPLPPTFR
eukprot:TRINITY_DN2264_c0_g1_i2.p1 TRINITY_DN2264_c0_g1~~TRINITY_DN2264_c0_g1_i2.p1  ORF type:complete len:591 (-),score=70.87 TRINITY_DN2264_c0_g1_i2:1663-3435(-)